jgi:hypothetical protein
VRCSEGLVGIGIFLDDRDPYRFRLPGHFEGLKTTGMSYRTNDMLFRTRRSLRYLENLDMIYPWCGSHLMWLSKETNGSMYWQMRDRSLELCFKTRLDWPVWTRLTFRLAQGLDCCRMVGKMKWQRDGPLMLFESTEWMASSVDKSVFLVWQCLGWRPTILALGPICKRRPLPVCHRVWYNRPWAKP